MKLINQNGNITIKNSIVPTILMSAVFFCIGVGMAVYGFLLDGTTTLGLVGAGVAVVGVIILFFAKASTIILSKSGTSSVGTKKLFGSAELQEFQLTDINQVELNVRQETERNRSGSGSGGGTSTRDVATIYLLTNTGQRIQLGSASRRVSMGGALGAAVQNMPLKKEADEIAAYIGVPMSATGAIGLAQGIKELGNMYDKYKDATQSLESEGQATTLQANQRTWVVHMYRAHQAHRIR